LKEEEELTKELRLRESDKMIKYIDDVVNTIKFDMKTK